MNLICKMNLIKEIYSSTTIAIKFHWCTFHALN